MGSLLLEVFDQQGRGEAPIDFDLVVARLAGALQDLSANIACQESNLPVNQLREVLANEDREAIGLLPEGAGGAPDVQLPFLMAEAYQFRQNRLTECLKRMLVTEE